MIVPSHLAFYFFPDLSLSPSLSPLALPLSPQPHLYGTTTDIVSPSRLHSLLIPCWSPPSISTSPLSLMPSSSYLSFSALDSHRFSSASLATPITPSARVPPVVFTLVFNPQPITSTLSLFRPPSSHLSERSISSTTHLFRCFDLTPQPKSLLLSTPTATDRPSCSLSTPPVSRPPLHRSPPSHSLHRAYRSTAPIRCPSSLSPTAD